MISTNQSAVLSDIWTRLKDPGRSVLYPTLERYHIKYRISEESEREKERRRIINGKRLK